MSNVRESLKSLFWPCFDIMHRRKWLQSYMPTHKIPIRVFSWCECLDQGSHKSSVVIIKWIQSIIQIWLGEKARRYRIRLSLALFTGLFSCLSCGFENTARFPFPESVTLKSRCALFCIIIPGKTIAWWILETRHLVIQVSGFRWY